MASVSYEVVDGVARITIERPDKRNAMDLAVFDELRASADRAGADPQVGAVVVTGRDGAFSSGIDVGMLADRLRSPEGLDAGFVGRLQDAFTAYEELDVPTLAVIEGPCFGAGLQLAIACHLRAVAPDAQLSVMETRWGLVPDLGGTWRLPRLVGLGRATELALTARRIDAAEALAVGLAEVKLPGEAPHEVAQELAARLAAGPGAIRRVPRLVRENAARGRADALAAEAGAQLDLVAGPDVEEAFTAHLEGRTPRFVGR